MNPLIDKKRLVAVLEASCKTEEKFSIGVEHEHFLFYYNHNTPVGYYDNPGGEESNRYGIRTILNDLRSQANWRLTLEGDNPITAEKDGNHITLEPGGQMELALKPMRSVGDLCRRLYSSWTEIHSVSVKRNIGFLHLGFAPWSLREMPRVPKQRYRIMHKVMPITGLHGLDMMHRTTSIQVSLDYSSEADMVKKFRLAMLLQPFIVTWFGNSPDLSGLRNYFSFRTRCWQQTDPSRCWFIPQVFADDFGFAAYADFALRVPMYFIIRGDKYIGAEGSDFSDFMTGRAERLRDERANIGDWRRHLGTIFTQARLRNYLEIRGCDGGGIDSVGALTAFLVGIFYDEKALNAAYDNLMRIIDPDKLGGLTLDAARFGWKVSLNRSHKIGEYSEALVALARDGLRRRSTRINLNFTEESSPLDALDEIVGRRQSPAQKMLKKVELHGRDRRILFRSPEFSFV